MTYRGFMRTFVRFGLCALWGATFPLTVSAQDAATAKPTVIPAKSAEAEPTAGTPKLVCQKPTYDFGTIMIGTPLEATFEIANEGTADLKITRVKPDCGCTKAGEYPKSIAPGKTGKFPFQLDPNKIHSKINKGIKVWTNDPKVPMQTLTMTGELKRYIDVSPRGAYYMRTYSETPMKRVVSIKNNAEKDMKLELVPDEASKFEIDLKEKQPGKVYELSVTTKPPYPPGQRITEQVKIKTNIEKQALLEIPVSLPNAYTVDVNPLVLRVPMESESKKVGKNGFAGTVRLTNYTSTPLTKIEGKLNQEDTGVTIAKKEVQEGKRYDLVLSFPGGFAMPTKKLTLIVETSDAKRSKFEVPIMSYILPASVRSQPKRPAMEMVGKPAPKLELSTLGGETLSSDEFKEHPATVLNFYAPNCPACKYQIPRLEQIRAEYEPKGVRFVNVTETLHGKTFTNEQIETVMKNLKTEIDVVLDPGNQVGRTYKVRSFPTMFVLDRAGKIQDVFIGGSGPAKAKSKIEALVKTDPKPAT